MTNEEIINKLLIDITYNHSNIPDLSKELSKIEQGSYPEKMKEFLKNAACLHSKEISERVQKGYKNIFVLVGDKNDVQNQIIAPLANKISETVSEGTPLVIGTKKVFGYALSKEYAQSLDTPESKNGEIIVIDDYESFATSVVDTDERRLILLNLMINYVGVESKGRSIIILAKQKDRLAIAQDASIDYFYTKGHLKIYELE